MFEKIHSNLKALLWVKWVKTQIPSHATKEIISKRKNQCGSFIVVFFKEIGTITQPSATTMVVRQQTLTPAKRL